MHIRTELPDDGAAVRRVVTAAFGRDEEADLVDALRPAHSWVPDLSVVALLRGTVVAHALMTPITVGDAPALALAPVSVLPDSQGHHFGQTLVEELLERARELRQTLVTVLGDPAYYARFGFRTASDLGVGGPFLTAGSAFQALRLAEPAPVGRAIYPAVFGLG